MTRPLSSKHTSTEDVTNVIYNDKCFQETPQKYDIYQQGSFRVFIIECPYVE